jgi:hypothetical protein
LNANFFCIVLFPVCFGEDASQSGITKFFPPTSLIISYFWIHKQQETAGCGRDQMPNQAGKLDPPFSKLVLKVAINTKVVSKLISRRRCSATW